jgi:hypothetical protein
MEFEKSDSAHLYKRQMFRKHLTIFAFISAFRYGLSFLTPEKIGIEPLFSDFIRSSKTTWLSELARITRQNTFEQLK